ncbi:hypothetical protein [Bremerella cremea]|uniref:hypothetical protein n=1 Tax=Bremerella cremea TaxID=1031537 RepID=UPI0011C04D88|nr:hypothetical protein [Bremerella cremea]
MEDIDKKYLWPILNWLNRWKSYLVIATLGIAVLCYIRYEWWQVVEMNRSMILEQSQRHIDESKGLEQIAQQGDAFGSVNAWFSGVAMLAAVLAIVFQAFEFSHQRDELAKSTQAHIDRLELDETLHFHSRRMIIIEFIRRLKSQEISNIINRLWDRSLDKIDLKVAFALACDPKRRYQYKRNESAEVKAEIDAKVQLIRDSEPLFNLMLEIGIFEPEGPELFYLLPVIQDTRHVLNEFFAASNGLDTIYIPLWVSAINRVFQDVIEDCYQREEARELSISEVWSSKKISKHKREN